jgi:hypothetical protein
VFLSTYLSVYFLSHLDAHTQKVSKLQLDLDQKRRALIKDNDVYRFNKTSSSVPKTENDI